MYPKHFRRRFRSVRRSRWYVDIHAAPAVNQGFCTSQSSEECRPEGMIQVAMLDPFTVSQVEQLEFER
jgi:hypothetical protein